MAVVDLTHAFGPGVAGSEEFAGERREQALSLRRDGFDLQRHSMPGAWATHVDAPAHMRAGAP
ncbi:cyclase family protein [Amycolatopsis sp. Hca4]|uniref:cyclase family protein n=1 Tax=Amycolatopsis sp. Hca4 TaxID=2742131 RepID=UPI0020CAC44E|nr:cyclase family protein [Amycolatopsis sp. Hca4]